MHLRREGAEISLATVYRHLTSLHEAGAIHAVYGPEGEALYRCRQSFRRVAPSGPWEVESFFAKQLSRSRPRLRHVSRASSGVS